MISLVGAPPTSWQWIWDHRDTIGHLFVQHVQLTVIAVAVGLAISVPLSLVAYRYSATYAPITWFTGLLYTIPSLALFAAFTPFTGLSVKTAEIGLVSYTLLILVRNIVVGLRTVPEDVKEAAQGMGYTRRQLLWRVEFPLAMPAIAAGIRVATVSTIGLITVAALIGKGGLGQLIVEGLRILYPTEILTGALASLLFALAADALLLWTERALTPWTRVRVRAFVPPRPTGSR